MTGYQGGDVAWVQQKSTAFDRGSAAATVVILPIGSTEQHGPHLPVEVDTMLVTEVARRGAERASAAGVPVRVLPTLWISLAEHHMAFGGSLTLDHATLEAFIRNVARSLQRQGHERVLLFNGHGGNIQALATIVDKLTPELSMPLVTATYFLLAAEAFAGILEGQTGLLHACEAETSMVLHLRPELVDLDSARTLHAPTRGLLQGPGWHRWRPIGDVSRCGVVGTPQLASAEKGARLVTAAANALAEATIGGTFWPRS